MPEDQVPGPDARAASSSDRGPRNWLPPALLLPAGWVDFLLKLSAGQPVCYWRPAGAVCFNPERHETELKGRGTTDALRHEAGSGRRRARTGVVMAV